MPDLERRTHDSLSLSLHVLLLSLLTSKRVGEFVTRMRGEEGREKARKESLPVMEKRRRHLLPFDVVRNVGGLGGCVYFECDRLVSPST